MSKQLLPVADALARILAAATPITELETVPLTRAFGRTLGADVIALRTQPPVDVSAMDGYALRAIDLATPDARVALVGESAAGKSFARALNAGESVRIFTGAAVPQGADCILVQEDAIVEGARIGAAPPPQVARHIRAKGLDFTAGQPGLARGTRLGPAEIALAAAMNHASVKVIRKPRVAIIATGDELVPPGGDPTPDQIVCSNPFAVAAYVEGAGGEAIDLGIVPDDYAALERTIRAARDAKADVLITLGGASVGDRDLVQSALAKEGMNLGFWRIALRPGKPLIHGTLGAMNILGLPGNPVSSIVCSLLFAVPLIRKLCGDLAPDAERGEGAVLGVKLAANDQRMDFMRASSLRDAQGRSVITPFAMQDSSMLSVMAAADCLLLRDPHAPAANAGDPCRIIRLAKGMF